MVGDDDIMHLLDSYSGTLVDTHSDFTPGSSTENLSGYNFVGGLEQYSRRADHEQTGLVEGATGIAVVFLLE